MHILKKHVLYKHTGLNKRGDTPVISLMANSVHFNSAMICSLERVVMKLWVQVWIASSWPSSKARLTIWGYLITLAPIMNKVAFCSVVFKKSYKVGENSEGPSSKVRPHWPLGQSPILDPIQPDLAQSQYLSVPLTLGPIEIELRLVTYL